MKSQDWVITFVWLTILGILGGIAYIAIQFASWIGGQPQVFAAIVSAGALLAGAVLTHYFTQRREQQNEQQRALRDNYMAILDRLDKQIRGAGADDDFSNIHLQTWVVGSPKVIEMTKNVLKAARGEEGFELRATLEGLANAMRKDVGLAEVGTKLEEVYKSKPSTGLPG
jgi:hypothetical protein